MLNFEEKGLVPIESKYLPLSNIEVDEIEKLYNIVLPSEYKKFILKFGHSSFSQFTSVYLQNEDRKLPISIFYGGRGAKQNLMIIIKTFTGRMPSSMIPFAEDPFGNQFCIGISGNDYGSIFFWDHELEPDPDDYLEEGEEVPENIWYENITKIADSFNKFFELLKSSC